MIARSWAAIAALLIGGSAAWAQGTGYGPGPTGQPLTGFASEDGILSGDRWHGHTNDSASPRFWASSEYLLWWLRGAPLPPLLTTGDPLAPLGGVLGDRSTSVLYGGKDQGFGAFSGVRVNLGAQLVDGQLGLEASGLLLESHSRTVSAASNANGVPLLVLPVYRSDLGREGGYIVSLPGSGGALPDAILGNATIASSVRLWGAEVNPVLTLYRSGSLRVDGLVGFRYLDLDETLGIQTNSDDLLFLAQTRTQDSFHTRNQFYGGQVGTKVGWAHNRLSVDLATKVALGSAHQVVDVEGISSLQGLGAATPGPFRGGVFAQPTNIGRSTRDDFAVVPQAQARIGYAPRDWLHLSVGYDFLYWSSVVRPGNQMDHAVNLSQVLGQPLVGPAAPRPVFDRSDFWTHGVSFGIELKF